MAVSAVSTEEDIDAACRAVADSVVIMSKMHANPATMQPMVKFGRAMPAGFFTGFFLTIDLLKKE
jgi:hypothetical protein